jgi:hypothetical protein
MIRTDRRHGSSRRTYDDRTRRFDNRGILELTNAPFAWLTNNGARLTLNLRRELPASEIDVTETDPVSVGTSFALDERQVSVRKGGRTIRNVHICASRNVSRRRRAGSYGAASPEGHRPKRQPYLLSTLDRHPRPCPSSTSALLAARAFPARVEARLPWRSIDSSSVPSSCVSTSRSSTSLPPLASSRSIPTDSSEPISRRTVSADTPCATFRSWARFIAS